MKDIADIPALMAEIGANAKAASAELAFAPAEVKTKALNAAADAVWERRAEIIEANGKDMEFGREKGLSAAMMDRLMLDEARIQGICDGLRAVAGQEDPVGQVLAEWDRPTGLNIKRVRTPLGVVGVIYESRPNVTADAGALCLKSGNAVILRGGSESFHSSGAIHACLVEGLKAAGLPEHSIQLVPTRDRAAVQELLTMVDTVDVIVPRGGKGLVGLVQREARVPVFAHLEGIVHIYLDAEADAQKALDVVLNAKTRRTGICGAAECLLIHESLVDTIGQGCDPCAVGGRASTVRADAERCRLRSRGQFPPAPRTGGMNTSTCIIAARVVAMTSTTRLPISASTAPTIPTAILTEDDAAAARFFERLDSGHPDAQCLDPVRRWRRVRHGGRDRYCHGQDACSWTGGCRTAHKLQISGRR